MTCKLINILVNPQQTSQYINQLSEKLTNKSFTGRGGGDELIATIQALRPVLIELYKKASTNELEGWFEE